MNQFAANVLIVVYQFTSSPELAISGFILAVLDIARAIREKAT